LSRSRMRACVAAILSVLLASALGSALTACAGAATFDARLSEIVEPYRFSYLDWEVQHVLGTGGNSVGGANVKTNPEDGADAVRDYVSLVGRAHSVQSDLDRALANGEDARVDALRAELSTLRAAIDAAEDGVEAIMAAQIRSVLAEQGIRNPADRLVSVGIDFPPIYFTIEPPPYLLVVSPRAHIESVREVLLIQDLDLQTMIEIEQQVDALGVSSLVLAIGGFGGVYPTFVAESSSLPWLVETATEEWLHQYLAFTPLGFRYVLDLLQIRPDYEIATLNETAAGMVSEEVGRLVVEAYYPECVPDALEESREEDTGFSFNAAMRETRITVDALLAEGKIDEAERYMEERRQYLADNGHHIRKINQAYFAFYGTYADEPASVSPIGGEMRALRARSGSLKEFLDDVAGLRGREDLREHLLPGD